MQTLVLTGKEGRAGLTLLLVPKTEAISVRRMELGLDGQETTAYVTFDDAVVPVSHRIGEEGQGFLYTVSNFNHERLLVAFQALSLSRICLRETIIWAEKREAFGKKLIEQPVVRWKLADLGRMVESLQSWTEQITYEMEVSKTLGDTKALGGVSALLKAASGQTIKCVADECQKIFGGAGMTKTGQGRLVEAITRRVPLLVIPGPYTSNIRSETRVGTNHSGDNRRLRGCHVGSRRKRGPQAVPPLTSQMQFIGP
jgi:alkylation response protein AidB-like acyl-CoA dehydrogenase